MKTPILSRGQRSAFAKFRCSVAPLKTETGRDNQTPICKRICFNCTKLVEDEIHVLILCLVNQIIRATLFEMAASLNEDFSSYEDTETFKYLLWSCTFYEHILLCICILCVQK